MCRREQVEVAWEGSPASGCSEQNGKSLQHRQHRQQQQQEQEQE